MQGNILTFSTETNTGIITGAENKRYVFSAVDWKEKCPVISRVNVDFVAIEDKATEIYCTDAEALQDGLAKIAAQKTAEASRLASEKIEDNYSNIEEKKSKSRLLLGWFSNKWAPYKEKIIQSKFGLKYPNAAKIISNGWVIIIIVFIASANREKSHYDRDESRASSSSVSSTCYRQMTHAQNHCPKLPGAFDECVRANTPDCR